MIKSDTLKMAEELCGIFIDLGSVADRISLLGFAYKHLQGLQETSCNPCIEGEICSLRRAVDDLTNRVSAEMRKLIKKVAEENND